VKYNYSETFECDGFVQNFTLKYRPLRMAKQSIFDIMEVFIDKGDGALYFPEEGIIFNFDKNILTVFGIPDGSKLIVNYNRRA